ncbi:MAG: DUF6776 family protein [Paraperlucidibaca sp.]
MPTARGPIIAFLTSAGGMVVIAILGAALGFFASQLMSRSQGLNHEGALQNIRADYDKRLRNERERVAVKAKEYAIIDAASQRLQEDNQELLASMSALESRVTFYKRMAAPKAANVPVAIELFELLPTKDARVVRYRLLIVRSNASGKAANGRVKVKASDGRRQVELSLDQPRFTLRYYQQFSGEWHLPDGFHPERVDVQVRSGGSSLERRYKWEVKTR